MGIANRHGVSHRQSDACGAQAQIRVVEQPQGSGVDVLVAGERECRVNREVVQQKGIGRVHRQVVAEVQVTHEIPLPGDLQALACVTWSIRSQARKCRALTQHQQTGGIVQRQVVGVVEGATSGKRQRVWSKV